ncbi:MAG: hypothetical protein JW828_15700 [Sedimentisphaerales bacterium]|nr:hypothetical protein [Sedimentisphaerales bacterium]
MRNQHFFVLIIIILLCLFVGSIFFSWINISCDIAREFDWHKSNKEKMLTREVYEPVARELARLCESIEGNVSLAYYGGRLIPPIIRNLEPQSFNISPKGARLEMQGGHDHYGYILEIFYPETPENEKAWKLSYYSEAGDRLLCEVTIKSNDRIPNEALLQKEEDAFRDYIRIRGNAYKAYTQRVIFYLQMNHFEKSLNVCKEGSDRIPDNWWLPLMGSFLEVYCGDRYSGINRYVEWVEKHKTFCNYFYLSYLYDELGMPVESALALEEAARQSLDRGEYDSYNMGFYAYCAIVSAHKKERLDIVQRICEVITKAAARNKRLEISDECIGDLIRLNGSIKNQNQSTIEEWMNHVTWTFDPFKNLPIPWRKENK